MAAAQSGDEGAYRALLGELGSAGEGFLRSRLGEQPFVEDCLQEALLAVHEARHSYDPDRPFRPWFYAILRYKTIDCLRQQRAGRRRSEAQRSELEVERQGPPRDRLGDMVTAGRLLAALSPQHREAIALTKIAGLSNAEAASQADISEGAMKVRVHRALGKLRRLLESEQA